jgi:hypothetical protein
MKRYQAATQKAAGKWVPCGDEFVAKAPMLNAMLTDAYWDDGKPREVCSLTIRLGAGEAKLSLNDQENEQSFTTTAHSVREAVEAMETALREGKGSWRSWGKKRK